MNMDKYGWIVLCNLWMIQLDLFWPTLTWLIFFKYCSDKKKSPPSHKRTDDHERSWKVAAWFTGWSILSPFEPGVLIVDHKFVRLFALAEQAWTWPSPQFHPTSGWSGHHLSQILLHLALFVHGGCAIRSQNFSGAFPMAQGPRISDGGWISDGSAHASHCNPWPNSRHCLDLTAARAALLQRAPKQQAAGCRKIWGFFRGKIYGSSAGYKLHTESYRDIVWYSMI